MRESAAEMVSTLFEPEVVLPSQFNVNEDVGIVGGERKLMAALLSDGIEAYIHRVTSPTFGRRPDADDVVEWVHTKDESYVFGFDSVCSCLGIDAEYLRVGLARYVKAIRDMNSSGSTGVNKLNPWKKIRRPRK